MKGMEYITKKGKIQIILEYLYLFFLVMFIAQEFLEFTMFPINWKEPFGLWNILNKIYFWLFDTPQYILSFILILRILFLKKYEWKYFVLSVAILWCARCSWLENHNANILLLMLLMIGGKDISFRKIVYIHMLTIASLLIITMGSTAIGLIENVVYAPEERSVIRYAFGMTYPTNFAAYVFYLTMDYWYWRGKNLSYFDIGITALLGIFVFVFCGARCSTICFCLGVIFMFFYKHRLENKGLAVLLSMSMSFASIGSILLSMFYTYRNPYLVKLDSLLSSRLRLGRKGIDIYGFRLWGQAISMNGNAEGEYAGKYFFLDSSYLQCGIIYGVVIMGLILLAFFAIGNQARRNQEWALLWIMALIAIHSIMEQHLLEISNCVFILAAFADRRLEACGTEELKKKSLEQV